jgi:nicotinamidase-related amidase
MFVTGAAAAAAGLALPASVGKLEAQAVSRRDRPVNGPLSAALLTAETSVVLLLDFQKQVMDTIGSGDHGLIELNARALARASRAFEVPVILSTIGVRLQGSPPTLPSIRGDLADQPEYDRNTMNAWEDGPFRGAITKTGRKRLIFAGILTEVCLLYPVLHAQREGFETYFVSDAAGGGTVTAHETAIQRMIQAGSQPVTVTSLLLEWIRDWGASPHRESALAHLKWYEPQVKKIRSRLRAKPYQGDLA